MVQPHQSCRRHIGGAFTGKRPLVAAARQAFLYLGVMVTAGRFTTFTGSAREMRRHAATAHFACRRRQSVG